MNISLEARQHAHAKCAAAFDATSEMLVQNTVKRGL